jgi:hypothetical protein
MFSGSDPRQHPNSIMIAVRGVTNFIAWNCQATQNAHGGYCPMNNAWDIGMV